MNVYLRRAQAFFTATLQKPELFFVYFALIAGMITVVILPPFMAPDENAHLYRSYQISEGHVFGVSKDGLTGGILPLDLRRNFDTIYKGLIKGGPSAHVEFKHFLSTKINTKDKGFVQFDTTSIYSPLSYIPQTIGVGLARLIYPSELAMLYIGRIFNLLAFVAMVYLAIRISPIKKWVFVAAALLPMSLQQAGSLSTDVTTIGLIFITIAFCLRLATAKVITQKQVIASFVLAVLLGLTKQTNALVLLPFLFLPTSLFGSLKKRLQFGGGLLLAGFGAAMLWYLCTKILHYNFDYSGNMAVHMPEQIHSLLQHPLHLVRVFFNTFIYDATAMMPVPNYSTAQFYVQSMVGAFSWILYALPLFNVILAYIALFVALAAKTKETSVAEKTISKQRLLSWSFPVTALVSILAMATILYLIWTPVDARVIDGIQGRYFIPLVPLLATWFIGDKLKLSFKKEWYIGLTIGSIILVNFITFIIQTIRYFTLGGIQ